MSKPAQVLALLEEQGGQSARDLREAIDIGERHISATLSRLKNDQRLIHISGWRRDEDGGRLYVRALYSLGRRRDAGKPPPLTQTEYGQRYRRRVSIVPSIFHLGAPIDSRRITARMAAPLNARRSEENGDGGLGLTASGARKCSDTSTTVDQTAAGLPSR